MRETEDALYDLATRTVSLLHTVRCGRIIPSGTVPTLRVLMYRASPVRQRFARLSKDRRREAEI